MKNLFNSIKLSKPKSNVFDLSHDVKLSLNLGDLVPIMVTECVPGDKFSISCESLLRFAPLVAPPMHRLDVTMHYFFVPNRILWPNWENFITQTKIGGNIPAFPTALVNSGNESKLTDYMGIPPAIGAENELIGMMGLAAYQAIVNEYYRDQNLMDPIPYQLVDGDNSFITDLFQLRKRCWEHDYFTAALPFAQKGDPVDIPLGEVTLDPTSTAAGSLLKASDHSSLASGTLQPLGLGSQLEVNQLGTDYAAVYNPNGSLVVDSTTINDLRRAFRLQEWLERNARGGTRYTEHILAHYGVRSSDKRMQRPEYITGTKSPVQISEVLNTTGTDDAPQGTMAGHAVSVTAGQYGSYFCEEHGYIIGIMSVMPKTAYQQGLARHWTKYTDSFDYYYPAFANIGEQEVKRKEVYAFQGGSGEEVFGYVPRYAEYKFEQNRVAGDFRTTLNFWHWGRIFGSPPTLNEDFVASDPSFRPFAVTDDTVDHLYAHVYNKIKAVRRMPVFGTPQF